MKHEFKLERPGDEVVFRTEVVKRAGVFVKVTVDGVPMPLPSASVEARHGSIRVGSGYLSPATDIGVAAWGETRVASDKLSEKLVRNRADVKAACAELMDQLIKRMPLRTYEVEDLATGDVEPPTAPDIKRLYGFLEPVTRRVSAGTVHHAGRVFFKWLALSNEPLTGRANGLCVHFGDRAGWDKNADTLFFNTRGWITTGVGEMCRKFSDAAIEAAFADLLQQADRAEPPLAGARQLTTDAE